MRIQPLLAWRHRRPLLTLVLMLCAAGVLVGPTQAVSGLVGRSLDFVLAMAMPAPSQSIGSAPVVAVPDEPSSSHLARFERGWASGAAISNIEAAAAAERTGFSEARASEDASAESAGSALGRSLGVGDGGGSPGAQSPSSRTYEGPYGGAGGASSSSGLSGPGGFTLASLVNTLEPTGLPDDADSDARARHEMVREALGLVDFAGVGDFTQWPARAGDTDQFEASSSGPPAAATAEPLPLSEAGTSGARGSTPMARSSDASAPPTSTETARDDWPARLGTDATPGLADAISVSGLEVALTPAASPTGRRDTMVDGLIVEALSIPEPQSFALLALGFCTWVVYRRRYS